MNTIKHIPLALTATLALIAFSCEKMETPVIDPPVVISPQSVNFSEVQVEQTPVPDGFRLVKRSTYEHSTDTSPAYLIEYEYDEAGNLVKESSYTDMPYGKRLVEYFIYTYDDNHLLQQKNNWFTGHRLPDGDYANYYYTDGRLTKEEKLFPSGHSLNYEYDGTNLVRCYLFDSAPDYGIREDSRYTYDDQNRRILEESLFNAKKWLYNEDGQITRTEYYDQEMVLQGYVAWRYDGRVLSAFVHCNQVGEPFLTCTHRHDRWGNITETSIDATHSFYKRTYKGQLLMEQTIYDTGVFLEGASYDLWRPLTLRYEYEEIK